MSAAGHCALRFTDELRLAAGEQWDRVVNHKFTDELAAGTIDRKVLKKYLIQDYRFLDAFVVLLASAIVHARSLQDRIPGCQFLATITGAENTYFERSLQALGCTAEERNTTPNDDCTDGFLNLMRTVAKEGTLGEILSVLVVCEWSYGSWGERVAPDTVRDDFVTYEWVDLHAGPYFSEVVSYLRGLLDREGLRMRSESDHVGREKCQRRFLEAVQLEEDFFENAYRN